MHFWLVKHYNHDVLTVCTLSNLLPLEPVQSLLHDPVTRWIFIFPVINWLQLADLDSKYSTVFWIWVIGHSSKWADYLITTISTSPHYFEKFRHLHLQRIRDIKFEVQVGFLDSSLEYTFPQLLVTEWPCSEVTMINLYILNHGSTMLIWMGYRWVHRALQRKYWWRHHYVATWLLQICIFKLLESMQSSSFSP